MFAEDLSVFISLDTPGSAAATVSGGGNIVVLFDNAYAAGLDGLVESAGPMCLARTTDVSSVVQGTSITIASIAYRVTEVQPDGFGVTTLGLEKA